MSIILNGKYYPDGAKLPTPRQVNSQHKQWSHDMQRRDHARDIIQAHKDGKPNGEFIRQYPQEAKQYFSEEEMRRYG